MTKGETAPEPSMDEILSSIRKIIAEDEVEDASDATAETPSATAVEAVEVETDEDDDILELTEDDEFDDASAAEEGAVADTPESEPGDVPNVETAAPEEAMEPAPAAAVDEFEQVVDVDQAYPDADPAEGAPVDAPSAEAADGAAASMREMADVLLDSGTATAASGALQRLSAAMAPGTAIPQGERTIEAFLADLVRPELKAWLDEHLPGLVERIVEREIKKLVRDAQPE